MSVVAYDNALAFDEDRHEYRVGGRLVPSVTQILAPLSSAEYRHVDRAVMEAAAALGTAVHKMIELDVRATLDTDSLSDGLRPYYGAWRNFRALSGFRMVLSESRVYSSRYGYAGTLDLAGWLGDRFAIIDAKRTAAVPRTTGPQTAGYEQALREHAEHAVLWPKDTPIDRYALHLKTDGKWALVPFTDRSDLRVFLSARTLYQWSHAQ